MKKNEIELSRDLSILLTDTTHKFMKKQNFKEIETVFMIGNLAAIAYLSALLQGQKIPYEKGIKFITEEFTRMYKIFESKEKQ